MFCVPRPMGDFQVGDLSVEQRVKEVTISHRNMMRNGNVVDWLPMYSKKKKMR